MTATHRTRTRPFSTTIFVAGLVALVGIAGLVTPVAAQAPPAAKSAPIDAPTDPVVSEAARRLSLGRDLLAVLGDRLTAQHVEENEKRAELDAQIENLDWRRRVRQSLLEKVAVDANDLAETT